MMLAVQPEFIAEWSALAADDARFTVLQEPPFVLTWYRQHDDLFEPVLVLAFRPEGRLAALMPLARNRKSGQLTHAGAFHAEYHGWLARPEIEGRFIEETLIALGQKYSLKRWQWNYLPPGSSTAFLRSPQLARHGIFSSCRIERSPLWNLEDESQVERLSRTKSIKNQFNRYKKAGGFYLERIRDKQRTGELLQVLQFQNDFRQEAMHQVRPFAENPRKLPFFLARQDFPEANHFTVLWAAGRPLSFHYGVCDKRALLLGLTAYDPAESRNSPGKLHLIELARLLRQEGYRMIDLSPGGDPYKEYFANEWQDVVSFTLYFSRLQKLRADGMEAARGLVKRAVRLFRIEPGHARQTFERVAATGALLRRVTPAKLFRRILRMIHEDVTYLQYRIDFKEWSDEGPTDPEVHSQHAEDLLRYDGFNRWLGRNELLTQALRRFSTGERLYSITRGDKLVLYGWLAPGGRTHRLDHVEATFVSKSDCAIIYDFFTNPAFQRQGFYQRALRQVLRDLAASGVKEAYVGVMKDNVASRRGIEKVGFRLTRTFRKKRILWIVRKKDCRHE